MPCVSSTNQYSFWYSKITTGIMELVINFWNKKYLNGLTKKFFSYRFSVFVLFPLFFVKRKVIRGWNLHNLPQFINFFMCAFSYLFPCLFSLFFYFFLSVLQKHLLRNVTFLMQYIFVRQSTLFVALLHSSSIFIFFCYPSHFTAANVFSLYLLANWKYISWVE